MPTTNEHIAPTHATRDTETPPRLPSISIIIPVYNVAPYVEECIRSVMAQAYTGQTECIIVDDCGQDNSIAICERLIAEYEGPIEFRILHHECNKGLSGARNTGIRAASNEYLYFLDSDDHITADCMDSLASLAVKYKGVDIVQGNIVPNEVFSFLDITKRNFPEYTEDIQWIQKHILDDIPMTAWNKLIRRSFVEKKGLFFIEGHIHEDEHWRYISHSHIRSIAFSIVPTYNYVQRAGSIVNSEDALKKAMTMLSITEYELQRGRLYDSYIATSFLFYSLLGLFLYPAMDEGAIVAFEDFVNRRKQLLCQMSKASNISWRQRLIARTVKHHTCLGPRWFGRMLKLAYFPQSMRE